MNNNIYICVRLYGGLGNQLFQFTAGIKVMKQLGLGYESLFLDTRFIDKYDTPTKYEIGFIVEQHPGVSVGSPEKIISSIASRYRIGRIINKVIGKKAFIGTYSSIKSINKISVNEIVMDGYFQDERILFENDMRVRIKKNIIEKYEGIIKKYINNARIAGVHIRRGDYLKKKFAKILRTIPESYYKEAVNRLQDNDSFIVFSDDKEISKKFAKNINGIDARSLGLNLDQEFALFVACNDYIIANSTYSWWACYLGHEINSCIISPRKWYHDNDRSDNNNLLLPNFTFIDK